MVFCGKLDIKCLQIYIWLVNSDHLKEKLIISCRPWLMKDIVYVTFIHLTHFFTECLIGIRQIGMKKINNSLPVRNRTHTSVKRGENQWTNNKPQEISSSHRALMKTKLMRKVTELLCRAIKWWGEPCWEDKALIPDFVRRLLLLEQCIIQQQWQQQMTPADQWFELINCQFFFFLPYTVSFWKLPGFISKYTYFQSDFLLMGLKTTTKNGNYAMESQNYLMYLEHVKSGNSYN